MIKYITKPLKEISISKRGAEISKKDLLISSEGFQILIGKDVQKYEIDFKNSTIRKNHKEYLRLQKIFLSNEIIYLRRVAADLIATLSSSNYAFSKNIYGIVPDKTLHKNFLCSLLNSSVLNFYYKKRFSTKKEDVFPEIQTYLFEQLPIKIPANQQPFITLVDQILSAKKQGQDTTALEHKIDVMVYHLYELTFEEACVIDTGLSLADFEKYKI